MNEWVVYWVGRWESQNTLVAGPGKVFEVTRKVCMMCEEGQEAFVNIIYILLVMQKGAQEGARESAFREVGKNQEEPEIKGWGGERLQRLCQDEAYVFLNKHQLAACERSIASHKGIMREAVLGLGLE